MITGNAGVGWAQFSGQSDLTCEEKAPLGHLTCTNQFRLGYERCVTAFTPGEKQGCTVGVYNENDEPLGILGFGGACLPNPLR